MDISLVIAICFVAVILAAGSLMLLLRDLFAPVSSTATIGRGMKNKTVGLRRLRNVFDEAPARSISGRVDQAFDHLVLETGYQMTPVAAFLMLVACGLLSGGLFWSTSDNFLATTAGAILGMLLPLLVMMFQRHRRMRSMREEFPTVLDMFARAVRAGESLDQAMVLVGQEAGGLLGKEFARCSREMEMGRSLDAVMKSLASRIRLFEMRILATTFMVQRQTGGNLAETLNRAATVMRQRLSARRQMRAATGAGRASAILIGTICPVTYLVMFFWQQEHMSIFFEDAFGHALLALAVALEVIGVIWAMVLLRNEG